MDIKRKEIIAWTMLILIPVVGLYGCRGMPLDKVQPKVEGAAPLEPSFEIQPPEYVVAMTHGLEGFEDCTGCHYAEGPGADKGATVVDEDHHCSACHDMTRAFPFDHGAPPGEACILCHRPE